MIRVCVCSCTVKRQSRAGFILTQFYLLTLRLKILNFIFSKSHYTCDFTSFTYSTPSSIIRYKSKFRRCVFRSDRFNIGLELLFVTEQTLREASFNHIDHHLLHRPLVNSIVRVGCHNRGVDGTARPANSAGSSCCVHRARCIGSH